MKTIIFVLSIFCFASLTAQNSLQKTPNPNLLKVNSDYESLSFPSEDGLEISARLYENNAEAQPVLLCHQARFNKQEYADIAPRLREMGYNALAIDQRSGGDFAGQYNETFNRAMRKSLSTDYIDAQQDIESALNFLFNKYKKPVILWGSSYSSALVFYVVQKYPEKVKAIISFSPGNYFGDKRENLKTVFQNMTQPFWVTSSLNESKRLSGLVGNPSNEHQMQFIPKENGHHGSRALWINQIHNEEYWASLNSFLKAIKN